MNAMIASQYAAAMNNTGGNAIIGTIGGGSTLTGNATTSNTMSISGNTNNTTIIVH